MEKKFKVGDFVRRKADGTVAKILIAKDGWVAFDEERRMASSCPMEDVEPIDAKTAFLSELKGLLEKYGADIWMDSYGFDANFLRIDLEGAEKQSFEVENGVINHDGEIKVKPLNPNWY